MSKDLEIRWEVADGYVGGSRPQFTPLYEFEEMAEDLVDGFRTLDETEDMLYQILMDCVWNYITLDILNTDEILNALQKRAEEIKAERAKEDGV